MLVYVKFSSSRKKEFQLNTALEKKNGRFVVNKIPNCPEAVPFLHSLLDKYDLLLQGSLPFDVIKSYRSNGDTISFEYTDAPSLQHKLLCALKSGNKVEFENLIAFYVRIVRDIKSVSSRTDEQFASIFGKSEFTEMPCCEAGCLDLNFDNIFLRDKKPVLIDYEWTFNFPIPADYIIFRALYAFYAHFNNFKPNSLLPLGEILSNLSISEALQREFLAFELNFQNYVSGKKEIFNKEKLFQAFRNKTADIKPLTLDEKLSMLKSQIAVLEQEAQSKNAWILKIEDGIREKSNWIEKLEGDFSQIRQSVINVNKSLPKSGVFKNFKLSWKLGLSSEVQKYAQELENLAQANNMVITGLENSLKEKEQQNRKIELAMLRLSNDFRNLSAKINALQSKLDSLL